MVGMGPRESRSWRGARAERLGLVGPTTLVVILALLAPPLPATSPYVGPSSPSVMVGGPRAALAGTPVPSAARATEPHGFSATMTDPYANWPMLGQNVLKTADNGQERTLSPTNASSLSLLWENSTAGPVEGSLAAVNGTLYFGAWDTNGMYAFNATDGRRDWTAEAGGGWRPGSPAIAGHGVCYQGIPGSGVHQAWVGVTSTPEIWNGTLLVGGGNNTLFAMNDSPTPMPLSQRVEWTLDLANFSSGAWQEHYVWASPLVYRGDVYIGEATGCEGPMVGQLIQVNLTTHRVAHIFNASNTTDWGDSIWGSPAVNPATNVMWVTTGNEYQLNCSTVDPAYARALLALNATNVSEVLGHWQEPTTCADDDFGAGPTLFNAANGTPMVAAANKVGTGYAFYQSSFYGGDTVASPAWTVGLSSWDEAPAAFDGRRVYFGDAGEILALQPDGTSSWTAPSMGFTQAGLTVADGLLVDAVDWTNYSGSSLEVRNASTGALLYEYNFSGQQINGEPVVADGRIFCASGPVSLNGTGHVYAFGILLGTQATAAPVNGSTEEFGFHSGVTGGMPPYLFQWDFGDGTADSTSPSPLHRYATTGTFNVTLAVTDLTGTTAHATTVASADVPVVSSAVSLNPVDVDAQTWLNATVSESVHNLLWSGLPPGCLPVDLLELACSPADAGFYLPNLTATTSAGDDVVIEFPELVVEGPLTDAPSATPLRGIEPLSVDVSAALSGGTPPYAVTWGFGDGGMATGGAASHTYISRGNFTLNLTGTDRGGGRVTWSATVAVAAPLAVNFSTSVQRASCNAGLVTNEVELSGSAHGGFPPYVFLWVLPGGNATGPIVNATFVDGGNATASLTVEDSVGATSRDSQVVALELPPCPPAGTGPHPPTASGSPLSPLVVGGAVGAALAGALGVLWWRRRGQRPGPGRDNSPRRRSTSRSAGRGYARGLRP